MVATLQYKVVPSDKRVLEEQKPNHRLAHYKSAMHSSAPCRQNSKLDMIRRELSAEQASVREVSRLVPSEDKAERVDTRENVASVQEKASSNILEAGIGSGNPEGSPDFGRQPCILKKSHKSSAPCRQNSKLAMIRRELSAEPEASAREVSRLVPSEDKAIRVDTREQVASVEEKASSNILEADIGSGNPEDSPDLGTQPIHVACIEKKSHKVIMKMLKTNPKVAQVRDKFGCIALHYACSNNSPVEVIKLLLLVFPAGARFRDEGGYLPIHLSCQSGASTTVIRCLLEVFPESASLGSSSPSSTPVELVNRSDFSNKDQVLALLYTAMFEPSSFQKKQKRSASTRK